MPDRVAFDGALAGFLRPEIFESIFEISSEAIWSRDLGTNQNYWLASKENQQKFGIGSSMPHDFWQKNIHPDDVTRAINGFSTALQNTSVICFEHAYRFRGANGAYHHIRDKMKFLRYPDGTAYYVVGAWRDTTIEHERQHELEQVLDSINRERERFKIISEISNAATWEVDLSTQRVHWYAGSMTLEDFNLTKEKYVLADWAIAIHDDDRARVVQNFNSSVQNDGDHYFDTYRVKKSDGSYACMIDHGTIFRDENKKAFRIIGGWIDITREYEREQTLRQVVEQERKLNEELAIREEELTQTEEELRRINDQLSNNIQILADHEFILNQSQRRARIGSWQLDIGVGQLFWSEEMFNLYDVKGSFNVLDPETEFYTEKSRAQLKKAYENITKHHQTVDVNVSFITAHGMQKWTRLTAYPEVIDDVLKKIIGISYDITLQKESEELLRRSEEKFGNAFNNNPDLMVITREEDLLIVDVNERVFPVLGYTREEVINRRSTEFNFFVSPSERKSFLDIYELHGYAEMECPWRKKDGSVVQLMITGSRIHIDGRPHFISVMKDISARKTAEEKFQKAFDLSPDLMLILRERDLTVVDANSKVFEFTGYTKDEVIGKKSTDIFLWEDPATRDAFVNRYFETGTSSAEACFLKKNNDTFFGLISTRRIVLNGEDHFLTVVRDITDKKNYERILLDSEANLNATINNTTTLIWSVDRQYRVVKFNKAFRDYIWKYYNIEVTPGERILTSDTGGYPEKRNKWVTRYERVLAGTPVKEIEQVNGLYLSYSFNPIGNAGEISGVNIFAEDITERILQEKELADATKKIGELKLTALRSVMNPHFIFNALNSIQFFIAKNDRQNAINYLSTFSKLIRGILTSSVENKIALSDELELLKYYINLEILRFENKFQVVYNIDSDLDQENIEVPSLLIQPFVENAIIHGLYSKKGSQDGRLTISVRREPDNRVLFEIADNGIGRHAAEKLKVQNFPSHKSMGAMLTTERLRMLNDDGRAHHETIDLMENGKPAGTLVKIWIPV